jgi:signal transduction histidine kinase/DNA-binding response OmpR family regulator/streptogramin lyase
MSCKSLYSLVGFVLLALAGHAQSGRIIKNHNVKDGLSQGVITSITQDDKGLMWFATEEGLNRFDGYSFKVFKYGASDNFVQHVFKDSEGGLWASSRRGIYHFDQSAELFIPYSYKFPSFNNDVTHIMEGSTKNLWVAWYVNGFALFDKVKKQFTPYTRQLIPGVTSNTSITLYEDSFGLLWVGSQDHGLNVFTIKKGEAPRRREDLSIEKTLPSFYVKCLEEDHDGNMWIGTTKGLVVYIRHENAFYYFNSSGSRLKNTGIFALLEDSDKHLWIGTQAHGVYKLNLRSFSSRSLHDLPFEHIEVLDQYNISQHTIRSLYEDKDKNIWMGTHGDGIYMISSINKNFENIQHKHYIKNAGSHVQYYGTCNDTKGNLWLGTDGDGIYNTTLQGDIIRHYLADGKRGSITDNVVLSALKDHDDNLWFGTYAHGLFFYDKRTDSFQNYNHELSDSAGHMGNQVRLLYEDSKKNIWVGASRGGLCLINKKKRTFRNFDVGGKTKNIDVRAMAEDKAGGLWIGCYGDGVSYLSAEGSYRRYFSQLSEPNFLRSNVVFALAVDRKGRVWIGTGGGGLNVYDPAKDVLKNFTEKNGLNSNTVYAIQIDETGKVWFSSNKGISKFDPDTERFFHYNSFDGLQEGQFNPGSSLLNKAEEYMCFGGSQGLTIFYPERVTENVLKSGVMISGIQLFNKPVTVGSQEEGINILKKAISETEEIVLKHDQSVFTFEFLALNYSQPEKNKYAYMLEGLEHDWNYVGNQRTATYRYLSPGTYTFKVKATNQDNVWHDEYTSMKLVVLPPFWKTPWAYLLYFLGIGAMAFGAVSIRRKQASLRKRLKTEKAQRKRERQMVQEKLSFFTEVSHEFRTPLTLIIGPLEDMLTREGNFTTTGKKLKMVYRNAHKLLNLINMLLDYRKVESGNMVLKAKEDNIVDFIEEIFVTFKELALRKRIRFELHVEQPVIQVWFDKEKMEMVLNNVLSNSFKYIGSGNAISVSVKKISQPGAAEKVSLEVRDNGIGIPEDQLKYIFDWFYQGNSSSPVSSGIGLALAKKLVYLHEGQILVDSTEAGTVFTINIPLGNEHFSEHDILKGGENGKLPFNDHTFEEAMDDKQVDPDSNGHKKGQKNILIVEDDEEIRSFLKDYLQRDYRIHEAVHGREALEVLAAHHADLIVSDIMMPEMNGIDFCKQLKGNIKTSHIPIILLTAKTSLTHHKEGLEIGADAYITKPFSPDILAITINNLFQSRENLKRFYRGLFFSHGDRVEKKDLVSPDEKFLHKIYELVKANLDKPEFSLDDVCDALTISRSLLYKKIKMLTGLSPVEYLRSLRLQEAAYLLRSGKYKVFEVVYMVGFTDLKYFRQCFIKEFGHPPSELLEK